MRFYELCGRAKEKWLELCSYFIAKSFVWVDLVGLEVVHIDTMMLEVFTLKALLVEAVYSFGGFIYQSFGRREGQ